MPIEYRGALTPGETEQLFAFAKFKITHGGDKIDSIATRRLMDLGLVAYLDGSHIVVTAAGESWVRQAGQGALLEATDG